MFRQCRDDSAGAGHNISMKRLLGSYKLQIMRHTNNAKSINAVSVIIYPSNNNNQLRWWFQEWRFTLTRVLSSYVFVSRLCTSIIISSDSSIFRSWQFQLHESCRVAFLFQLSFLVALNNTYGVLRPRALRSSWWPSLVAYYYLRSHPWQPW